MHKDYSLRDINLKLNHKDLDIKRNPNSLAIHSLILKYAKTYNRLHSAVWLNGKLNKDLKEILNNIIEKINKM